MLSAQQRRHRREEPRNSVSGLGRRDAIRSSRRPRPMFELLEQRAMLSVAQDIVSYLTPYQSALNSALAAATSLPLVGKQLAGLQEFTTILQDAESNIAKQTQSITTNGHYQFSVPLAALAKSFSFSLGLDAFLKASAAGNVSATINPTLDVGFDYQNGVVSLDASQTDLDVGFDLTLPNFTGTFSLNGLLYVQAVDAGTDFHGDLNFAFDTNNQLSAQFSGEAKVLMGLSISFADPSSGASFNPTFKTTLDIDWKINSQTNQMQAPSISLDNFGLDADSFLHGFLGNIVTTVQKFTKPIQPFIDFLQTPVPILSSFGDHETIATLLEKGEGASAAEQQSFNFMLTIIQTIDSIDLSGSSGGAVIPFGTITLTGDPTQAGAFGFDTSGVSSAIQDVLNTPALKAVSDALQSLSNVGGGADTASEGFEFGSSVSKCSTRRIWLESRGLGREARSRSAAPSGRLGSHREPVASTGCPRSSIRSCGA